MASDAPASAPGFLFTCNKPQNTAIFLKDLTTPIIGIVKSLPALISHPHLVVDFNGFIWICLEISWYLSETA